MVLEDERNTISSTLKTTIPTDPALHAVGLSLLSLDLLLGNQRSIFVLILHTNQWSSTREIGWRGGAERGVCRSVCSNGKCRTTALDFTSICTRPRRHTFSDRRGHELGMILGTLVFDCVLTLEQMRAVGVESEHSIGVQLTAVMLLHRQKLERSTHALSQDR